MTKKDYQLIAEVIRKHLTVSCNTISDQATIIVLAKDLAVSLGIENPAFRSEKFLSACGVGK